MPHIFSVMYWIWVCISWAIMDVIYCILSDALRYTDIIWVLRAHAAVTQYCRCWLLFSLYVIFFNRFRHRHWCVGCTNALTNSANLLLFSLFFGHGGFVCAKISFSINLSVIMGFSRINSICAMWMFMSFYINFNPTNSHFARIPKNAFD